MPEPRYKRPFDLLILVAAHVALAPLWLLFWTVIPAAIWLNDRGPIFYTENRVGRNGKVFKVRKFRTMVSNSDEAGPRWTEEKDTRITVVGRVLRRTAMDEIPGLAAIWTGNMSFVGPRPLNIEETQYLEKKIAGFERRSLVRPGLTGLAQLYNPGDGPKKKLKLDLMYIRRMNLWLDFKIVVYSVFQSLSGRWDSRHGK